MNKIYMEKEEALTAKRLQKIIQYHRTNVLPQLVFNRGYYEGIGQQIMKRVYNDPSKPNNRIVKNYCKTIVENFRGYITGNPVTYSPIDSQVDIYPLLDCLRFNDYENIDSEWLKNALIYGYAPQLCYVNEAQEKRFKNLNPQTVIPVYSADLDEELLYVIYYYPIVDWDSDAWESRYSVNVYDATTITHFTCDSGFNSFAPDGDIELHYFSQVPFSIFYLTDDMESIFKCVIGLQDAYNKMLSDSVNDWQAFVDAYLVLTNVTADSDDIAAMKENRVLVLDDDATAAYLTKNSSDTIVQNLLDDINTAIHTISNSPDFSSEEFGAGVSSGKALQFKLVGFNNIASNIESQFKKALYKRIHLLNTLFSLVDSTEYDVKISFTHNLPKSIADEAESVSKLRGMVSQETLLGQLSFITDVNAEMEKVKAEQDYMSGLYDFGNGGNVE